MLADLGNALTFPEPSQNSGAVLAPPYVIGVAKQWLKVPGMGPTLLNEMEASMRGYQGWAKGRASERVADAELLARLERLQRDLERFRRDLLILMSERQSKDGSSDDADLH
jgi:hypothetical protein